jgi:hypothetical protein
MSLKAFIFKPIDHIQISIWRILFGLVLFFESIGSNLVGWTRQVFIDPPQFTFNFIGFEWLQPLPGNGMYVYFYVMAVLAICITIGYRYRLTMILFTIAWAGVYFMHKTSYNNHHYLMLILCIMMCFTPAHANLSMDARQGRFGPYSTLPAIFRLQYVVLILVVYVYASVAKLYPDWTTGEVSKILYTKLQDNILVGWFFRWDPSFAIMAWAGILYDLLIIPMLLYRRTRVLAFFLSLFFHLFNSITLQIGTFPYMMIGASVLFFSPERVRRFFRQPEWSDEHGLIPLSDRRKSIVYFSFIAFVLVQIALPLRHHLIPGDVLWTEEGHRLSWRMMLRSKQGNIHFTIKDKDGELISHDARDHLSKKQYRTMATHPDFIWQYVQYLKESYGSDIEVYVISWVRVNGRDAEPIIDPDVNMAKAKWHIFGHESWVLNHPDL